MPLEDLLSCELTLTAKCTKNSQRSQRKET